MVSTKPLRYIQRVVSVLRSFSAQEPELGPSDISRKIGIPRATSYRILVNLANDGFLDRNINTGRYVIGPVLYTIGSLYLGTTDLLKAAEPVVKTLNELTDEAVNVGILEKGYVTLTMREESRHAVRLSIHIGSIFPAHASALGKALLSELTDEEIDNMYPSERLQKMTDKTIATKTRLKLGLEQIKKTGVSFDREGAYEGAEGFGSVIRNVSGKAIASISISVPVFRIKRDTRKRLSTLVKLGSSLISYRIGYQDRANPVCTLQEIRSWWEQNQLGDTGLPQVNSLTRGVPI